MGDFWRGSNSHSNDELAAMLTESAELVKQGKRDHPTLSRTLEAFLLFMENSPPSSSTSLRPIKTTTTTTSSSSNNINQKSTTTAVNKPAVAVSALLGKMMGAHEPSTAEQRAATSRKNADRLKAELQENQNGENNDKSTTGFFSFPPIPGFTDDASIKQQTPSPRQEEPTSTSPTPGESTNGEKSEKNPNKAEFQRSSNPKSALIANGWIEQQRRSKFRSVWKEVLASLVEGRKKGEETTLWIQRQVINPNTNQKELEALHQIPVKWLEEVTHYDFYSDNRFSLKVFNLQEEFVFRCSKDSDAAQNWVDTLLAAKEGRKGKKSSKSSSGSGHKSKSTTDLDTGSHSSSTDQPNQVRRDSTTTKSKQSKPDSSPKKQSKQNQFPFDEEEKKSSELPGAGSSVDLKPHRSIKELRAIAHGAGIQTAGMERKELETVVERILGPQTDSSTSEQFKRKQQEELDRLRVEKERLEQERRVKEEQQCRAEAPATEQQRQQAEESARLKREEMERLRQEEDQAQAARRAAEEQEHRQRIAERVRLQQEEERKRWEEEERIRQENERIRLENERRQREEAEHRRRVAEMQEKERQEQIRKQQEEYARQQKLWQEQQAEAARIQRLKEEQEARAREEVMRRRRQAEQWAQSNGQHQQPWHPHHPPQQPPPQQQQHPHAPPPHGYVPQQQYPYQQQQHYHHPGQPQQQQHYPNQQPPGGYYGAQQPPPQQPRTPQPQPHTQTPPPPRQEAPQSPISQKYAKMASLDSDDGGVAHKQIKHSLLVQWALQPPMLQALKPIETLITTVHTVFPPSFGVAGHEYFKKWKAVQFPDISTGPPQNRIDGDKLNKTVRKLRFFLHPDKLPGDLTPDQSYIIKLLWDITNDAFEEYKKKEEDLGWIRS
ncbi:hypothetical protein ACA910_000761 [Epithemia clementina (nom. ined.)]